MSLDSQSIQVINQMIYEVTEGTELFPEEAFNDDFAGEKPTMEETQVIINKITKNMGMLSGLNSLIHLEEITHMINKEAYLYIKEKNIRYITTFKNMSSMKSGCDEVKKDFGYIKGLFLKLISRIVTTNVEETKIKLNNIYEFIGNAIKHASQCILSKKGGFFEGLLTIGTCVLGGTMGAIKRYIEPDENIKVPKKPQIVELSNSDDKKKVENVSMCDNMREKKTSSYSSYHETDHEYTEERWTYEDLCNYYGCEEDDWPE